MTFGLRKYIILLGYKKEVMKMPRTGRPTSNPKGKSIHVRLDEKSAAILEAYIKRYKVTRAEAIRRGIEKLSDEQQ